MPDRNNKSKNNFNKLKSEMKNKKSKAEARKNLVELTDTNKNADIAQPPQDNDLQSKRKKTTQDVEKIAIQPPQIEMKNKKSKAAARKNLAELADTHKNADITQPPQDNDFQSKREKTTQDVEKIAIQPTKIELLVFRVAEEEFALKLFCVKEIIRVPAMTIVPNAPHYIAGLCDLRGRILPVIDSHKWFGIQNIVYNENSRIIVTDILGKNIGMITDKVSEVLSTETKNIKEPPDSIKSINGSVVNGMLMLDNGKRIIMLLDAEKIGKSDELDFEESKQQVHSNSDITDDVIKAVEEEQIVAFSVGNEEYAIDINYVKEIIKLPDIVRVPNTAEYIEGILTLRNHPIAVINFGKLLNLNCEVPDENSRVLIIDAESFTYGIIADKVSEVVHIQKNSLMKQSHVINGKDTDYIKAFISLNNGSRLIMLLEPNKILTIDDVSDINEVENNKTVEEKSNMLSLSNEGQENIIIFKVGQEEYGIEVNYVQEINRISESVSFPGAPDFIEGMANLRGDVIPILNLRKMLGIAGTNSCSDSKIMIVECQMKKIGIAIDSVSEILKISKEFVEEVPEVFSEKGKNEFVNTIAKLNDGNRIVLMLNLNTVFSFM